MARLMDWVMTGPYLKKAFWISTTIRAGFVTRLLMFVLVGNGYLALCNRHAQWFVLHVLSMADGVYHAPAWVRWQQILDRSLISRKRYAF
jgi:hypothetical protein